MAPWSSSSYSSPCSLVFSSKPENLTLTVQYLIEMYPKCPSSSSGPEKLVTEGVSATGEWRQYF